MKANIKFAATTTNLEPCLRPSAPPSPGPMSAICFLVRLAGTCFIPSSGSTKIASPASSISTLDNPARLPSDIPREDLLCISDELVSHRYSLVSVLGYETLVTTLLILLEVCLAVAWNSYHYGGNILKETPGVPGLTPLSTSGH